MTQPVKIDVVSDVACPWCAVGLGNLEQALDKIGGDVKVEIHFQPFELNPDMPPGGQDAIEHLTQKYGISEEQVRANQKNIRERAAEAGFSFHPEGRKQVYNTFHAHRLLHWAHTEVSPADQVKLKRELLITYFCLAVSLDEKANLLEAVKRAGLDVNRARAVLDTDEFTVEVRASQQKYLGLGIHSVPSFILNDKYLIQGAQPAATLEQAIRQVSQES
jgi:predicted DsbA family dithiol-disulfide isomerase